MALDYFFQKARASFFLAGVVFSLYGCAAKKVEVSQYPQRSDYCMKNFGERYIAIILSGNGSAPLTGNESTSAQVLETQFICIMNSVDPDKKFIQEQNALAKERSNLKEDDKAGDLRLHRRSQKLISEYLKGKCPPNTSAAWIPDGWECKSEPVWIGLACARGHAKIVKLNDENAIVCLQ